MGRMTPTAELLQPEVVELIREGRFAELREALHHVPPADVAEILSSIEITDCAPAFRFLQRDDAAEVFSYLSPEKQEELLAELGTESAANMVEAMEPDDRARLIDELPGEVAQRLVAALPPETRKVTQAILGYPPRSVGRLMTPDYIRVRPEWTVEKALEHIRRFGRDAETINVVYVVDEKGVLVDDMRLRQIFLSDPAAKIESLMNRSFSALKADQPESDAVAMMKRYDRVALPVVDSQGVLLGIVTHDDVADVAEQEATEDIQKLGGVGALETAYINTPYLTLFHKRGFWLSALFVGQSVTIFVLGVFQDKLERAVELGVLMPLVISCGGNSGSQAATLVTRALALGEIGASDWARIVRRELVTGSMLAVTLGVMGFVCVEVFTRLFNKPETSEPMLVGATVAVAIFGVVMWGTMLGSLLPLLLRKLRFDPATASSPLVATLMDASGTIIYFLLAILILTGTLL